ncbi:MAG: hypothetical protein KQH67_09985 [Bacteroidetes bacterium]|nr:hypothetical protein [Bacteroidota bacterium]
MKAIIKSTAIIVIATFLFSFSARADVNFNEEAYIDDIPFNTEAIYSKVVIKRNILDFEMQDEAYINDIPFSTETIAEVKLYDLAMTETFAFDEETYIDDIPFNTEEVCQKQNDTSESDKLTCDMHEMANRSNPEKVFEIEHFN